MYNIEEVHCLAAITAVLEANLQLMHATVAQALKPVSYGKTDTLGLDGIPEAAIVNSLRTFDRGSLLITEELGTASSGPQSSPRTRYPPAFYLSDPTDRSDQLQQFLCRHNSSSRVGDIVQQDDAIPSWERDFGSPASITGATSAITSIRYGVPIASAIVNFITQELFVAYRDGVFRVSLPSYSDLNPAEITLPYLRFHGTPVGFRKFEHHGQAIDNMRHFVTFLGKSGYNENLRDSDLVPPSDVEKYLRYGLPGGPSRILYLSTVQPEDMPVGFVLANGEKIGEWVHWLPFVRFGKTSGEPTRPALSLYEIHQARPWTKDGILMSTPEHYSIFARDDDPEGRITLAVDRFRAFPNPSRIRSTLLAAPVSNSWAMIVMQNHTYRQIEFADPAYGA